NQQPAITPQLLNFLGSQCEIAPEECIHIELLRLELHLPHLHHIYEVEGKSESRQCQHGRKRGRPADVTQDGVTNNLYVKGRWQEIRDPANLDRYVRDREKVTGEQQ